MAPIKRQLKTLSGGVVSFILVAIVAFFILNLIQTKGPGPIASWGGWLFNRATGDAYSGGGGPAAATPAATSPYSLNSNLGPAL